jgi:hypothetical protein
MSYQANPNFLLGGWGYGSVGESLPSMREALESIPSTAKTKQNKKLGASGSSL